MAKPKANRVLRHASAEEAKEIARALKDRDIKRALDAAGNLSGAPAEARKAFVEAYKQERSQQELLSALEEGLDRL